MQNTQDYQNSRAVANVPRNNDSAKSNTVQLLVDERPEAQGHEAVLMLADSYSDRQNAEVNLSSSENPAQFALPGSYQASDAPGYNPHGKTETYRNGVKNYNRLAASGFSGSWRGVMMKYWDSLNWVQKITPFNGDPYYMVREAENQRWVNANGVQLDHSKSVNSMKGDLISVNEGTAVNAVYSDPVMKNYYHIEDRNMKHVAWPKSKKLAKKRLKKWNTTVEPTIHGARKYYHDRANLVPRLGVDNASKGDKSDENFDFGDFDALEVQKEWVEMQAWLSDGVRDKDWDEADEAVDSMRETLDTYDGTWPFTL